MRPSGWWRPARRPEPRRWPCSPTSPSPDEVASLFEAAGRLGRVAALVNNAGIADQKLRVDQLTPERLLRMTAVNVVGPFLCAGEAVRRMSSLHGGLGGAIVNISSIAARLGRLGRVGRLRRHEGRHRHDDARAWPGRSAPRASGSTPCGRG